MFLLLSLGSRVAIFWERAVHSVNRMFSLYKTIWSTHLGFEGRTVVLIEPVPGHCLSFTLQSSQLM